MEFRRRASAACVHDGKLLLVRLRDPHTKITRSFLPGGKVEAGETPVQAAERETREETGYDVAVEAAGEIQARYPFVWNGRAFDVLTYFYRACLKDEQQEPRPVSDAPYHRGAFWAPLADIEGEIAFDANILAAVSRLLKGR